VPANKIANLAKGVADTMGFAKIGNWILAYLVANGLFTIVTGIATLVLGLKVGVLGDDPLPPQNATSCYSASDMGHTLRYNLSGHGVNVSGSYPKTILDVGQLSEWVNTGFVTSGEDMEIYVRGTWYPWGKANTPTSIQRVPVSVGNTSSSTETSNNPEYVSKSVANKCIMNTDLSFYYDKNNPQSIKEVNQISRYNLISNTTQASIDQQYVGIMDVHCLNGDQTCQAPNLRGPKDHTFAPCAIDNGHGVYMRIGGDSTNYAYHLANQYINVYVSTLINGQVHYVTKSDLSGNMQPYLMPFTLPTKIYQQNRPKDVVDGVTSANSAFIPSNQSNTPNIFLMSHGNNSYNIDETKPPAPNQAIYLKINDTYYGDNDGTVEVVFKSGAMRATSTSESNDSFFTTVVNFFFTPLFGPQLTQNFTEAAVDTSKQEQGIITEIRNGILSNANFQIIRILVLISVITLYGYHLIMGTNEIKLNDLIKKIIIIGFVAWGTMPQNYQLIDDILIPIFLKGFSGLASMLASAAASVGGFSINVANPFRAFDIMIASIFSEVISYKILALFMSAGIAKLTLLMILALICIVVIIVARAVLVVALSIASIGITIILLPIVLLTLLHDKTKEYFDKWKNALIKEGFAMMLMIFIMTLFLALVAKYYFALFNFDICWQQVHSVNILFLTLKFFAWSIVNQDANSASFTVQHLQTLLLFAIMSIVAMQTPGFAKAVGDVFGTNSGGDSLGEKLFGAIKKGILGDKDNFGLLTPLTALSDKIGSLRDGISSIDRPDQVLKGIGSSLGGAVAKKIENGLSSGVKKVGSGIKTLGKKAATSVKNKFNSQKPSTGSQVRSGRSDPFLPQNNPTAEAGRNGGIGSGLLSGERKAQSGDRTGSIGAGVGGSTFGAGVGRNSALPVGRAGSLNKSTTGSSNKSTTRSSIRGRPFRGNSIDLDRYGEIGSRPESDPKRRQRVIDDVGGNLQSESRATRPEFDKVPKFSELSNDQLRSVIKGVVTSSPTRAATVAQSVSNVSPQDVIPPLQQFKQMVSDRSSEALASIGERERLLDATRISSNLPKAATLREESKPSVHDVQVEAVTLKSSGIGDIKTSPAQIEAQSAVAGVVIPEKSVSQVEEKTQTQNIRDMQEKKAMEIQIKAEKKEIEDKLETVYMQIAELERVEHIDDANRNIIIERLDNLVSSREELSSALEKHGIRGITIDHDTTNITMSGMLNILDTAQSDTEMADILLKNRKD